MSWGFFSQVRSSYCKGPATFLFESGAGDEEKTILEDLRDLGAEWGSKRSKM